MRLFDSEILYTYTDKRWGEHIVSNSDLIIIGNGFDLTCNLKSTYTAYFNDRFSKEITSIFDETVKDFEIFYKENAGDRRRYFSVYARAKEKVDSITPDTDINIWDIILYYGKGSLPETWNDVESRILEFLIYESTDMINSDNSEKKLELLFQDDYVQKSVPNYNDMKIEEQYWEKMYNSTDGYSSFFYSQLILFAAAKFGIDDPTKSESILLDELKKFEINFSEYLIRMTGGLNRLSTNYLNNSDLLFATLVNSSKEYKHHVLSFNYTYPFFDDQDNQPVYNVHGTLIQNNIIFGVDQSKVKTDSYAYRFTKTYRQLLLQSKLSNAENTILPMKSFIRKIIFYGHSLSSADYSYFQSIFDYYDVYNSDLQLIFYYHTYDNNREDEIQQNQVISASRLLKQYGATMSNKDHGDNLLHKLILEKRLLIKEIKIPRMKSVN